MRLYVAFPLLLALSACDGDRALSLSMVDSGAQDVDLAPDPDGGCSLGGTVCPEDSFCEMEDGTCGRNGPGGHCAPTSIGCPHHIRPVCGCDGRTYGNDCERQRAGVSFHHDGNCDCVLHCPPGQWCMLCTNGLTCMPAGMDCR